MRTSHVAAAIMSVALFGATSSAQAPKPTDQLKFSGTDGPAIVRMILTMQANKPYGPRTTYEGGYGTLAEILALLPSVEAKMTDDQTASIGDYTIRITRSADRRRFDVSLMEEGRCSLSWFSNEKNIIYSGRPLGCG